MAHSTLKSGSCAPNFHSRSRCETGSGERFRLKAVDGDGDGAFTLEMPWAAAECLFGGVQGKRQIRLESLEQNGGFALKMSGDNGSIKVAVD
jgi:hypothetical protein